MPRRKWSCRPIKPKRVDLFSVLLTIAAFVVLFVVGVWFVDSALHRSSRAVGLGSNPDQMIFVQPDYPRNFFRCMEEDCDTDDEAEL